MKKVILWGLVILIILCSGYIVKLSFGNPKIDILEIGTFMALTLTLIALIFYAYDTNLLASISKLKWERETVLNTTYEMVGIGDSGGAGRILFRINNPSTLIIRAKVWAEFKVYGSSVDPGDDFNGTKTWLVFPQQTSQGWYEISNLLAQQGKTVQQMINEYSPENRTTQLALDLTIEFRDEIGYSKIANKEGLFCF